MCFSEKSEIYREILAYLSDHPEAQDTYDGISHWWILERKIIYHTNQVEEAIAELVADGFVVEQKSRDSRSHYQINRDKYGIIKNLLGQKFG